MANNRIIGFFPSAAFLLSLLFYGCGHFDVVEHSRPADDVAVLPQAKVEAKSEPKKAEIITYKGHEYIVYAVQGSYIGLTHSPECHCTKKGD